MVIEESFFGWDSTNEKRKKCEEVLELRDLSTHLHFEWMSAFHSFYISFTFYEIMLSWTDVESWCKQCLLKVKFELN